MKDNQEIAEAVLSHLDELAADLPKSDYLAILEELEAQITDRVQAARQELDEEEEQ